VETGARIFGQDDARQIGVGRVVTLESTLRTTLRALAVCAVRRSDERTVRQLVERARELSEQLTDAVEHLDEGVASRDAQAIAEHLEERLATLERMAEGRRSAVFFS
jgi:hypothetical protein